MRVERTTRSRYERWRQRRGWRKRNSEEIEKENPERWRKPAGCEWRQRDGEFTNCRRLTLRMRVTESGEGTSGSEEKACVESEIEEARDLYRARDVRMRDTRVQRER